MYRIPRTMKIRPSRSARAVDRRIPPSSKRTIVRGPTDAARSQADQTQVRANALRPGLSLQAATEHAEATKDVSDSNSRH